MTTTKRNLWILITISAVFVIVQHLYAEAFRTHPTHLTIHTAVPMTPETPAIDAFVSADLEPEPINLKSVIDHIGYPLEAKHRNIEGRVIARILVDEQGNYVDHKIHTVGQAILAEAVDAEIHRIGFIPALKNGSPVQCWVNIPFVFKISEN